MSASLLSVPVPLQPAMDSLAVNLVYAGHLTHPGPGVPPALVSGILAANLLHDQLAPRPDSLLHPDVAHLTVSLAVLLAALLLLRLPIVRASRALHKGGRTYFAAASTMPATEFARIAALYEAFRAADDLVDCTHVDVATRAADLDRFEAWILSSEANRQGYPPSLWRRFFAAMRADTAPGKLVCKTREELIQYMSGSAAVLGEFMLPALGGDPRLVKPARALGFAFQLTNMLRDVAEDGRLGRQYVPADECAAAGIPDGDIAAAAEAVAASAAPNAPVSGAVSRPPAATIAAFQSVMERMFALADAWYAEADTGIVELPSRTRAPIALARVAYHRLHDAIRAADYVLLPRVVVPWHSKLADAASLLPLTSVLRMVFAELAMRLAGVLATWGPTVAVLLATWLATQVVDLPGQEVTYSQFHAIWTLPALALVAGIAAWRAWRQATAGAAGGAHGLPYSSQVAPDAAIALKWTLLLCGVATAYTTPWDGWLIQSGVWASSAVAGVGPLGIPWEEYAFFVLATLLTCGTWMCMWPARWRDVAVDARPNRLVLAAIIAVGIAGAAAAAAGGRIFYAGALAAWAAPVLALQWAVGGHILAAHAGPLLRVILAAGGSMAIADGWAIQRNIWVLNPALSVWPWARGLHPEEVAFFLITGAMCSWGLTLAVWASRGFTPVLAGGLLQSWVEEPRAPLPAPIVSTQLAEEQSHVSGGAADDAAGASAAASASTSSKSSAPESVGVAGESSAAASSAAALPRKRRGAAAAAIEAPSASDTDPAAPPTPSHASKASKASKQTASGSASASVSASASASAGSRRGRAASTTRSRKQVAE